MHYSWAKIIDGEKDHNMKVDILKSKRFRVVT